MSRKAQGDRAQEERHRSDYHEAEDQREPGRGAVLRRGERGGVGRKPAEHLLAERHHACDASEQHEPEAHHRG
jgi:hypothetical protein